MTNSYHVPILVDTIVSALTPKAGKKYIDATFGGGGHTKRLLEEGACVLGLDQDDDAIEQAKSLSRQHPCFTYQKANFTSIGTVAKSKGYKQVDGILFDLGVSSWQLDQPTRGFSFSKPAQLDMRMDQSMGVTAADLIAALGPKELTQLFRQYGDEPKAKLIASQVVALRKTQPITTTTQLAELIARCYRHRPAHKIHPATKVFQALRIAVNDELHSIETALPQAIELLVPGGMLAVMSFHEGEDRIVKRLFREVSQQGKLEIVNQKVIIPDEIEIKMNPRARSAKLRLARKI